MQCSVLVEPLVVILKIIFTLILTKVNFVYKNYYYSVCTVPVMNDILFETYKIDNGFWWRLCQKEIVIVEYEVYKDATLPEFVVEELYCKTILSRSPSKVTFLFGIARCLL